MTISRHTLRAFIPGRPELKLVASETHNVKLDESWSPYAQASIVVTLPDDLDDIDPRLLPRVALTMEQEFGASETLADLTAQFSGGNIANMTAVWGGKTLAAISAMYYKPWNNFGVRTAVTRYANLALRDREIDWSTHEATLALVSDEMLLQDFALVATAPYTPAYTTLRPLVSEVLASIGAFLQAGSADGAIEAASAVWLPGVSAWDFLAPLVQATGLRLYCDENRAWYLIDATTIAPGALVLSEGLNLLTDTDTIATEGDWADAVVVTYSWTDDDGTAQKAYDAAQNGITVTKVLALTYETPYPGPGAAANVLRRATGQGRTQAVTSVNNYAATPTQPLTISVAGDDQQVGYVSAVTWQWPDDVMTVSSRGLVEVPPTSWRAAPTGLRWRDVAHGITWNSYPS